MTRRALNWRCKNVRKVLSDLLVEAAEADPEFLVLSGDHGYALFDAIREKCPNQFLNCGIAEQNLVGVAAGLAKAGMHPVVYGLAAFVPIRVLEQIKIDVCFEGLPVIFLGDGAGFVYGGLGPSHQCTEDVASLRAVGGIDIYAPADRQELIRCFAAAQAGGKPAYIRLGKADLGDVHTQALTADAPADIFPVIAEGRDNLCLASGSMVRPAKTVIESRGLGFDLYSVAQLKGGDPARIAALFAGRKRVVTIEEHSVYGGLGSLTAEIVAGMADGPTVEIVGVRDTYSLECGSYAYMLHYHGLDEAALAAALSQKTE